MSVNGVDWLTVARIDPTDTWQPIAIDLAELLGDTASLRFVLDGQAAPLGTEPDTWPVREVELQVASPTIVATRALSRSRGLR